MLNISDISQNNNSQAQGTRRRRRRTVCDPAVVIDTRYVL